MFTFSGEMPFKESTRLAGVLQLSDMHKMRAKVLEDVDRKEETVSWVKDNAQFALVCRQNLGQITWQLHHCRPRNTSLILQSNEIDLQTVHSHIIGKTNEVVRSEQQLRLTKAATLPAAGQSDVDLSSLFQTRVSDTEWVEALIKDKESEAGNDESRSLLVARAFCHDALTYVTVLSQIFNEQASEESFKITISAMGDMEERVGEFEKKTYTRWRAGTPYWSLSARVHDNCFELFLVRSSEVMLLTAAESEPRREMQLHCTTTRAGVKWWNGALPVTAEEMRMHVKNSFAKLITKSLADFAERRGRKQKDLQSLPVEEVEKHLLAQKILMQQEQLQRQMARDLHDGVIADLCALKSAFSDSDGAEMPKEQVVSSLEAIETRLREVCYELSPGALRDWGLKTTLQALIDQASQRTEATCIFSCEEEIPQYDASVELHIFRIIQECINSVLKYSKATEISLIIAREENDYIFAIKDNGKGIDFAAAIKQAREGGIGMTSMQERVSLIRAFHPANITVRSKPGRGTMTRLTVQAPDATG